MFGNQKERVFMVLIGILILGCIMSFFLNVLPSPRADKRTIQTETKQEVQDYLYCELPDTNYLKLVVKLDTSQASPSRQFDETVLAAAKALTEIKQKYQIGQVIAINERTFLIEIIKEKPSQSSPPP